MFLRNELKLGLKESDHLVLVSLLETFIKYNKLSLRNIIKYRNISIPNNFKVDKTTFNELRFQGCPHIYSDELWFESNDVQILYLMSILSSFFGTISRLTDALKFCSKFEDIVPESEIDNYIKVFAIILRYLNENNNDSKRQYLNIFKTKEDTRGKYQYILPGKQFKLIKTCTIRKCSDILAFYPDINIGQRFLCAVCCHSPPDQGNLRKSCRCQAKKDNEKSKFSL